jgi:hypothetical protein
MKTHQVLDLHYTPDEGQGCFTGTKMQCEEFASSQSPSFMYKVVPMTKEEIEIEAALDAREEMWKEKLRMEMTAEDMEEYDKQKEYEEDEADILEQQLHGMKKGLGIKHKKY